MRIEWLNSFKKGDYILLLECMHSKKQIGIINTYKSEKSLHKLNPLRTLHSIISHFVALTDATCSIIIYLQAWLIPCGPIFSHVNNLQSDFFSLLCPPHAKFLPFVSSTLCYQIFSVPPLKKRTKCRAGRKIMKNSENKTERWKKLYKYAKTREGLLKTSTFILSI